MCCRESLHCPFEVVSDNLGRTAQLSMSGQTIRKGSWVLAVKVFDDEVWESVKSGDRTALSIQGQAERVPVGS